MLSILMFSSAMLLVSVLGLWQLDDVEAKGNAVKFTGALAALSLILIAVSSMGMILT